MPNYHRRPHLSTRKKNVASVEDQLKKDIPCILRASVRDQSASLIKIALRRGWKCNDWMVDANFVGLNSALLRVTQKAPLCNYHYMRSFWGSLEPPLLGGFLG